MSGISGFCSFAVNYNNDIEKYDKIMDIMGETLKHRGNGKLLKHNNKNGIFCVSNHNSDEQYAHVVQKDDCFVVYNGSQPEKLLRKNHQRYIIVFDGEIYNKFELKRYLRSEGFELTSDDDCEIVLNCFICLGYDCASIINGIFAFAIWDDNNKSLFLCRDRLGVKPLFYTIKDDQIIFASEMKALFKFPGIEPKIDRDGLCEIFGLFPTRTEGNGVFAGIAEINPGHFGVYKNSGFYEHLYWEVTSSDDSYSLSEAIENTRYLVEDSIKRQLVVGKKTCTFLSGGIDSSIVTAVAAKEFKKSGERLDTFSFDYEDNELHFTANDFQKDTDRKWATLAAEKLNTNNHFIVCPIESLADDLFPAVIARDLPAMADVDSSMLYFCREASKTHNTVLTGECADEFFGGYMWFHSEEALNSKTFPWNRQLDFRKSLISKDITSQIDIDGYINKRYSETISQVPYLETDTDLDKRRRDIAYLNMKWFLANLRDRTERCGSACSISARVPFADYRLVEFLWNVPWKIKCDGTPKSLLRHAFSDILPEEIVKRRKSAFPKTYHPGYDSIVRAKLKDVINDKNQPINQLIDKKAMLEFLESPADVSKPWFGQLMATPQLIAFYLQLNFWILQYNVKVL